MGRIQNIKSEIDTDPLVRGYAGMTDRQVADSMNASDRPVSAPITSDVLLGWAAAGSDDAGSPVKPSRILRIKQAAAGTHWNGGSALPESIKGVAEAAAILLTKPSATLDVVKYAAMLVALEAASIIDTTEKTELETIGMSTQTRGAEIDAGHVKEGHVAHARSLA